MNHPNPLAIIGMACRLPGGITDPGSYWRAMMAGKVAIGPVPADRWSRDKFASDSAAPGLGRVRGGGFLDGHDVAAFDYGFFGISAREAAYMDPQQRLLLEVAWEAIADAGCGRHGKPGSSTGVFVGAFTADYGQLQFAGDRAGRLNVSSYTSTGMVMTMLSNRLSHAFDLTGPSLTIDTACSSSLAALDVASSAIARGECDSALVGGVNLMLAPNFTIAASQGGFLSPTSEIRPFDARANGYVRSEGASVLVVMPVDEALRRGLRVHAVIRGTGTNQDGRTNGITVPSGAQQEKLMREVLSRTGLSARDIHYVEAHGTGTPVGDPIETKAIGRVFGAGSGRAKPVTVTSVKGNLGHLEAAAGATSLIRAALCLENRLVPRQADLETINPAIECEAWGIDFPRENRPLPGEGTLRAAVNSFGFGGTNAHVVIESAPAPAAARLAARPADAPRPVVVVSARSPRALAVAAAQRADLLERGHSLAEIAGVTWRRDDHHLSHRVAVHADSPEAAAAALRAIESPDAGRVALGGVDRRPRGEICFVYTGMGPQWWGMARGLITAGEGVFLHTLRDIDELLAPLVGWSLLEELGRDEAHSRMDRTVYSQPANFAIQVALTVLLESWGVTPSFIVGHSAGEPAAAWASGTLSLQDAVTVIAHRARLQDTTSGLGRLAAVGLPADQVLQLPWLASGQLELAAVNDAASVAVVGPEETLDAMADALGADVFMRKVPGGVPYHSSAMDPLEHDIMTVLANIDPMAPALPLYSTVTGGRVTEAVHDAAYWWQNVRSTVRFHDAVTDLVKDGARTFVEVGPSPTLRRSIEAILRETGNEGTVTATLNPKLTDAEALASTVADLFVCGHDVAMESIWPEGDELHLPSYPWDRSGELWVEAGAARIDRLALSDDPLLGERTDASGHAWRRVLDASLPQHLQDHRVGDIALAPGALWVSLMQAAARSCFGVARCEVTDLAFERGVPLDLAAGAELETRIDAGTGAVQVHVRRAPGASWELAATSAVRVFGAPCRLPWEVADALPGQGMSADVAYTQFARLGFHYGPAFRLLDRVRVDGDRVSATVDIASVLARAGSGMTTDPALTDAAFQMLLALAGDWNPDGDAILPVGVGSVRVADAWPTGPALRAEARLALRTDDEIAADAWLVGDDGTVIVEVHGFRARRVATDTAPRMGTAWLYHVAWEPDPVGERVPADGGLLLLADPDSVLADAVADSVRRAGRPCAVVDPGGALEEAASGRFTGLADLRPLETPARVDHPDLAARRQTQCTLALVRNLVAREAPVTLTVVTRGAVPRPDTGMTTGGMAQSGLWGLVRTLHQESATLGSRLIDVPDTGDALLEALGAELACPDEEDQVLLTDSGRRTARLQPSGTPLPSVPTTFDPHSTCLLTGGLGALGTLFTQWLVERGARHIVITTHGRVAPESEWATLTGGRGRALRQIAELRADGIDITVHPVDVTDTADLRRLSAELEDQGRPPIRAVLHTAGAVHDEMMAGMSDGVLDEVLAPKMSGAWALHEALGDGLDHFICFSSVSSVVVTAGQGNYAAGNAFMDALAAHRASNDLPAQSWNWGPWNAGMIAERGLEASFARRGIDLIQPGEGERIASTLLGSEETQQVVVSADWAKVVAAYAIVPRLVQHLAQTEPDDRAPQLDEALDRILAAADGERAALIEQACAEVVSATLHTPVEQLARTRMLNQMGLDSIVGVELRVRLERVFGVAPSLVFLLQQASIESIADEVGLALAEADDVDLLADLAGELDEASLAALLNEVEGTVE